MKISVLGAGAIGSLMGGLIKHHDPETEVLLIARGEHGEQMRRQGGVNLQGEWGEWHIPLPVSDSPADIAGSTLVLLTVKSPATEEAICAAKDYLGDATLLSIQNGVNQRTLVRYLAPEQLVMGVTATNMAVSPPGTVSLQRNGPTLLGPSRVGGALDRVRSAAQLLSRSTLPVVIEPNMLGAQYNKLMFNAVGAASSLSALHFLRDAVLHRAWRNAVAVPLQQECLAATAGAGVRLARIPGGADVFRFRRLLRLLNLPLLGRLAALVVRRGFTAKPILFSLEMDLRRGRPTEIDFISGEFVRLANSNGGRAPLNRKVVELTRQLEQAPEGTFLTREEVISAIRRLPSLQEGKAICTPGANS